MSHLDSMEDPLGDLELNARSHLVLLEFLRATNPGAPVVFDSDNATAAGTLEYANWTYTKR